MQSKELDNGDIIGLLRGACISVFFGSYHFCVFRYLFSDEPFCYLSAHVFLFQDFFFLMLYSERAPEAQRGIARDRKSLVPLVEASA